MTSRCRLLAVERACGLFPKRVRPGDTYRLAALARLLTDPAFAAAKERYAAGLIIGDDDESKLAAWREVRWRNEAVWDEWRHRHLYCDQPSDDDPALVCEDCRTVAPPMIPDDSSPEQLAAEARAIAIAEAELAAYCATLPAEERGGSGAGDAL